MDEPFASVDAQTRADLEDLVLEVRAQLRRDDRVRHPRHRRVRLPERPDHRAHAVADRGARGARGRRSRSRATRSRRRSCRSSRSCARTSGARSSDPRRRAWHGRADPSAGLPRRRGLASAARLPGLRLDAPAPPEGAAGRDPADADRADRAAARRGPRAGLRRRPHDSSTRASRWASGSSSHGRVLEEDGRPVRDTLVEVWQCNSAGRYRHEGDRHPAPLDPNFTGLGRCLTDAEGRYRFVTIKPGAYPWGNHQNAWRPAHIHFSLFGRAFTQRLVTQMYFPGDPLFEQDPIFNSVRDPAARRADGLRVRPRGAPSRSGRWPTAGTSCCAGRGPRRPTRTTREPRHDAVADGRPVLLARPAVGGRAVRGRAGHAGRDPDPRAACSTATGSRSPTRSSRPGRPTPTAASTIPTTRAGPAPAGSAASAAAPPTEDGRVGDRHAQARSRAGSRRPAAGAAPRRLAVRPRAAAPGRHADLLRRRGGGQRRRPGARAARRRAARDRDRCAGGRRLRDRPPPPGRAARRRSSAV